MEIHERIEVAAGPGAVWEVLSDPYAVVACVPGAEILGEREDGSFDARMSIKFGPTRIGFNGRISVEFDDTARQGRVTGRGKDAIGGTRVHADARFVLTPEGSGSAIQMDGKVEVSGRLATFIEAGAGLVVQRMSAEFAQRLSQRLDAGAG